MLKTRGMDPFKQWLHLSAVSLTVVVLTLGGASVCHAGFTLGGGLGYAVLYQGGGGNRLEINNGAGPGNPNVAVDGNIGIAGTGRINLDSVGVDGNIDFVGAIKYTDSGTSTHGTLTPNVTGVQTAMDYLSSISQQLGAEAGTSITLAAGTINGSAGKLDLNGNRVFTVSSVNLPNGTLKIVGDGHNVVFNISANTQFHANQIQLVGLTSDQVLFNFWDPDHTSGLTGGPTLSINSNGNTHLQNVLYGTFLDPFGKISMDNTRLNGRVFGGDSAEMSIVSGVYIVQPVVVPEPTTLLTGALLLLPFGATTLRMLRRKPA